MTHPAARAEHQQAFRRDARARRRRLRRRRRRNSCPGRRERRRQIDAGPHSRRRVSARPRQHRVDGTARPLRFARTTRSPPASPPSRRSCAWSRRCRSRRTSRSATRRCAASGHSPWSTARACARTRAPCWPSSTSLPTSTGRSSRSGFAERQLVAIAKALRRRCRVFILDEPTAALEKREIERLFAVLARMKAQGTAIIYISHRLDEVVALADRCTVLRDGRVAAVSRRGEFRGRRSGAGDDRPRRRSRGRRAVVAARRVSCLQARPDGIAALALRGQRGRRARRPARQRHRPDPAAPVRRDERAGADQAARRRSAGSKSPADAIAAGIGMVPGERRSASS